MASTTNDTLAISQTGSGGFPDYLDFDTLRTNAINYLGPITSKYWTDYNIHDPGITTLEMLMYAVMDLGYRANLPIGSLISTGSSSATNFFTPAQVMGCNPTSITDLRKVVMDVGEVRNAWVEVDESYGVTVEGGYFHEFLEGGDRLYVNGICKVYLELEKDESDFSVAADSLVTS